MRWTIILIASLLIASGCSVTGSRTAVASQSALVGVSGDDLSLCAGLPSKTGKLDSHTELRTYEYKPDSSNSVTINLPVIGGGMSLGDSGDCKATFKLVDGRVVALRFAGDTDSGPGGRDANCAPIVAHCLQDLPPRTAPSPGPLTPRAAPSHS